MTSRHALSGSSPDRRPAAAVCLIEDDGISAAVNATRVTLDLAWTADEVELSVSAAGDYPLPYQQIRVIPRQAERRRIRLHTAEGAPSPVRG